MTRRPAGASPVFVYENTNLPFLFLIGIRQFLRLAIEHAQLPFWWFDWDDLCDGFFYVAFAEQDAPTDFMGFDFTAINSGCECNKGDFQKSCNLFPGEVMLVLLSSNRSLHLLHFFVYGFPDHFGKSFDGQTIQDKLFFCHIINRLMIVPDNRFGVANIVIIISLPNVRLSRRWICVEWHSIAPLKKKTPVLPSAFDLLRFIKNFICCW